MAIPFGVASRLRRNCSGDTFLTKRLQEYSGHLVDLGYSASLVSRGFSKAAQIPRIELLPPKTKNRGVHAHSCLMGNQGKMAGN